MLAREAAVLPAPLLGLALAGQFHSRSSISRSWRENAAPHPSSVSRNSLALALASAASCMNMPAYRLSSPPVLFDTISLTMECGCPTCSRAAQARLPLALILLLWLVRAA